MAAPAGTLETLSRDGLWNLTSAVWLMGAGAARVLLLILLTCKSEHDMPRKFSPILSLSSRPSSVGPTRIMRCFDIG